MLTIKLTHAIIQRVLLLLPTALPIAATLVSSTTACADELDDIQRARETAEMQYVNELGSGKYKTAEEREGLKKKFLDPHAQRAKDYFKAISVMPTPREVNPDEIDLRSGPKTDLSAIADGRADSRGGTSSGGNSDVASEQSTYSGGGTVTGHSVSSSIGSPTSEKAPLRPEFVLDGSNVPKEITFGVPNFESPNLASPTPPPSSLPKKKPGVR